MSVPRWKLALLCLGFLTFASALSAQKYAPKKITFSGVTESQAELLAVSGLKPGTAVGQVEIQAAAQKLIDTGMFSDVRFSFDGIDLNYALKPAATMEPVRFDNFPWWDAAALDAAVATKVPLFHGSVPPESAMQRAVAAALTALLAEKGVTATVTGTPGQDGKTNAPVVEFHIDAPAVQVGSVHLSGVSAEWAEPVLAIQKAAEGQTFDPATEATLGTALRAIYHRQGYLNESVSGFTHGAPEAAEGKILVPVSATVMEGAQYRVRGMHFAGDAVVSAEAFNKMAKLHLADIANEDLLRGTLAQLAAAYKSRGYLRAKVDATPTLDAGRRTVDYAIAVEPGPVFHMGRLTLVNLNDQQTEEVRHCWPLHEGDVYDAVVVPQFLNRYKNQLHSLDGWSASFMAYEHEDTQAVDLVVTFHPGGTLR
ncbi:MAG TPA: POTRA domain-containing protein [Acidobacteriaceae bacterium]|jgi:outer membrane protein insertion porin family|nr:POTRA domain-containing protein [Acidobacteriaceae bacterium]